MMAWPSVRALNDVRESARSFVFHRIRYSPPIAILLGCLSLVGCSAEVTPYQPPLEGTFLWEEGKEPRELDGSTVEFEFQGKVVAKASLTADGTFILTEGLPEGSYRVRLEPSATSGHSGLHIRYQSFDQSGLVYNAPASSTPQRVNYKLAKAVR